MKFLKHFNLSRERFYGAETLREFAKDTLPEEFTFLQIQDQILDGVTTAYNSIGQIASFTYPNGSVVTQTYSERGNLEQTTYDGTVVDIRTYDLGGRIASVTEMPQ